MTSRFARNAYAHGHLGARIGARPGPSDWARLQAVSDAQSYIAAARRTAIAGLMDGISQGQKVHAAEAALRQRWREEVKRVERWYSGDEREVIDWLRLLCDLPAIAHLATGGAAAPWMTDDPYLAPFLAAATGDKSDLEAAKLAAFEPAFSGRETVEACWFGQWRRRWPKAKSSQAGLEWLSSKIAELSGDLDSAEMASPDALEPVFSKAFRRYPQSLVAGVAYLGLVSNDLRRLRGQVTVRLALPALEQQEAAA